ncbi:FUSC family protein [Oryzihumus sp.]
MTLPRHGPTYTPGTAAAVRSALRGARDVWHRNGRAILTRTARLTFAAVVAYVVAVAVLHEPTPPLTGPLTALLVVQATLFSTLTAGLRRVASVLSGVLISVVLTNVMGLTWWSLGIVIALALLVGHLVRLGEHLLEAPISAMLILGVSSTADVAASYRIGETLVGAGVGILVNVLLPQPVRVGSAGAAVEQVATDAAALLDRVGDELPQGASRDQAYSWLGDFRALSHRVDAADRAIVELAESRRLNPRAVRTADTTPMLRSGLDALEHSVVSLRALFRSIADGLQEEDAGPESAYTTELLGAFGALLHDLAGSLRAYGSLVRAEGDPSVQGSEGTLADALDSLRETRAFLTELLLVDARESPNLWLLRGSLLAAVERVLRELDLDERRHRRQQWEREQAERRRRLSRRPVR